MRIEIRILATDVRAQWGSQKALRAPPSSLQVHVVSSQRQREYAHMTQMYREQRRVLDGDRSRRGETQPLYIILGSERRHRVVPLHPVQPLAMYIYTEQLSRLRDISFLLHHHDPPILDCISAWLTLALARTTAGTSVSLPRLGNRGLNEWQ